MAAGGPTVKGRDALALAAWRFLVASLKKRCGGRCEVPTCRRLGRLDPHHVVKRSQGGADSASNLVMLCRPTKTMGCHDRTDLPEGHSARLVVEALGEEAFLFYVPGLSAGQFYRRPFLPDR